MNAFGVRIAVGNTSFVAIPYNSPHKDAAMVVADFLLDPATQAHAQDITALGAYSVLDPAKLSPAQQALSEARERVVPGGWLVTLSTETVPDAECIALPGDAPGWLTLLKTD